MPKVTRWFLFSSLGYLGLSVLYILVLGLQDAGILATSLPASVPLQMHLWALGWLTQMVFGVAYWLFPTVNREKGRGNEGLMWVAWWAFNTGLPVRLLLERSTLVGPQLVAYIGSGVLLLLASLCFVANISMRVR